MVDPRELHPGDFVRLRGRVITELGPDDVEYVIARPGDVGTVTDVEPYRGLLGELLGSYGTGFRVKSYTVQVAFPDSPLGAVDCLPEELE